jgi:diadenylate cyclase
MNDIMAMLPDLQGGMEILCLAVFFYYIIFFLRGTRGMPVLLGLIFIYSALLILTNSLGLHTLNWILNRSSVYVAVAMLIIFQPEIRRALAEIGRRHFLSATRSHQDMINEIVKAAITLAKKHMGALIAIERSIGTLPFQETGVKIDAEVSSELLTAIFFPYSPLHDGGVIIVDNRIAAARCMFPLYTEEKLERSLGMRHKAALGLSQETDAVVIVVSEETGIISVCVDGSITQHLSETQLKQLLTGWLNPAASSKSIEWLSFIFSSSAKKKEDSKTEQDITAAPPS